MHLDSLSAVQHIIASMCTAQRSNALLRGQMNCTEVKSLLFQILQQQKWTAKRSYTLLKGRVHCSKAVCTAQRQHALLKGCMHCSRPYTLLKGHMHYSKAVCTAQRPMCTAQRLCAHCSAVIIFIPRPLCFAEWKTKACYTLFAHALDFK